MSEVYLAVRRELRSVVVVKVLRDKLLSNKEMVRLFEKEGRILSRLFHPNVIRVVEHGRHSGRPYVVLEYLAGDHLGVLLNKMNRARKRLSPSSVARIALQAVDGLVYIHAAKDEAEKPLGLVHGDISPQNLFLTYDGHLKVLDFGISKTSDNEDPVRTGFFLGKLSYMAPEIVTSGRLDARSDIFSMGVTIWELLTNRKLFKKPSGMSFAGVATREKPPSPRYFRPEIPRQLAHIVMRCLHNDPDQRLQTAVELRRDLWDFLSSRHVRIHPEEVQGLLDKLLENRKKKKQALIASLTLDSAKDDLLPLDWSMDEATEEKEGEKDLPDDPAITLREALYRGRGATALKAYRTLCSNGEAPNLDPWVSLRVADLLEFSGHFLEAAQLCVQAAEKDSSGPLAAPAIFRSAALLLGPARQPDSAALLLQRLIQSYPDHALRRQAERLLHGRWSHEEGRMR